MTYTEVHANFCEQQITVRKVLVLSDTLDIRHHAACIYILFTCMYSNTYIIPVLYTCSGSVYKCHNNKKLVLVMHLLVF